MFGRSVPSVDIKDILSKVDEGQILFHYFGVTQVPFVMRSPLREDSRPSFGFYSSNGTHIHYKDFATGEQGSLFDLLLKIFHISFSQLLVKINDDLRLGSHKIDVSKSILKGSTITKSSAIRVEVKVRPWESYDIEYWESYGCNIQYLKYAEVYPISHKIIYKDNKRYTFACDRLAYVFIERKEGIITKKIYQPLNTNGYKWTNSNDKSVVGLWTKIPETGDTLLICSSLKDSICLWSNVQIPCIYVQSETTGLSDTALNCLRKRYNHIYIAFDGDDAGETDAYNLRMKTGFEILHCPRIDNMKDWSDLYKGLGKKKFLSEFNSAFSALQENVNEDDYLPF